MPGPPGLSHSGLGPWGCPGGGPLGSGPGRPGGPIGRIPGGGPLCC